MRDQSSAAVCGGVRRTAIRSAISGAVLACTLPGVALAANVPADDPVGYSQPASATGTQVSLYGVPVPAFTPGLPPPQVTAQVTQSLSGQVGTESGRSIAAGVILILFAGLAGLTYSMWRDLGRRVGAGRVGAGRVGAD